MSLKLDFDFAKLETRAWKLYRISKKSSTEFKPICDIVLSLIGLLHLDGEACEGFLPLEAEEDRVRSISSSCDAALSILDSCLSLLRSGEDQNVSLAAAQQSILNCIEQLESHQQAMRFREQEKIAIALTEITLSSDETYQHSLASHPEALSNELVRRRISPALIAEEFLYIKAWRAQHDAREKRDSPENTSTCAAHVEAILSPHSITVDPNFALEGQKEKEVMLSPQQKTIGFGAHVGSDGLILQSEEEILRHSIARKPLHSSPLMVNETLDNSHGPSLDDSLTTRDKPTSFEDGLLVRTRSTLDKGLMMPNSIIDFPDGLIVQSPSTAQENHDGLMLALNGFEDYVQSAIDTEYSRLRSDRKRWPELFPPVYGWCPEELLAYYAGHDAEFMVSNINQKPFSIMTYHTAQIYAKNLARLTSLLSVSTEKGFLGNNDGIIAKASSCLSLVSQGLNKFFSLRDQYSATNRLSDLDVLDYEHSTAGAVSDEQIAFPGSEMESARQAYYELLTTLMGFIEASSALFQGRTYITRSRSALEYLWQSLKMNEWAAWIEKQLLTWEQDIESLIMFCRHWHSSHPHLHDRAIGKLKGWRKAQEILVGGGNIDLVEMKLISASPLPKPGFLRTTYRCYIGFCRHTLGTNRPVASTSLPEVKTTDGVWNKTYILNVPSSVISVELVLYMSTTGSDKLLGKSCLPFSMVPCAEASFMDRSLMYGIDEVIEVSLEPADVKAKEKQVHPIFFKIGLKWQGRYPRVERAGSPSKPPGKMFRADITGIPYFPPTIKNALPGMPLTAMP